MPSVPVRYRRAEKGLFAQKLQHAIPSFAVLGHGVDHLQHDPHGASLALGLAEVSFTILLAAVMVGLGLGDGRLAAWGDRRRELRVTDEGVSIPGRFFKRLTLAWHEVAEVAIGPDKARLIAVDGRDQAIDLADALNPDAIRHLLSDAKARLEAHRNHV